MTSPPFTQNMSATYQGRRGRTLVFGGDTSSGLSRRLWEYDGATWADVTPSGEGPIPRRRATMAYDSDRDRVVVFGGTTSLGQVNDLWELEPPTRPAVQLTAGLPSDLRREAIQDVRVRAFCGGTTTSSTGVFGAALDGWNGAWKTLGVNAATLEAVRENHASGRIAYAADDPAVARGLHVNGGEMVFRCRPFSSSGDGFARVGLDYLEVRVRYDTR